MSIRVPAPNGQVVLYDVRWQTYESLLKDRGEHGPRFTFDRGTLEIMSPSRTHELLKKLLARLIEVFTLELKIRISSAGSTTLKSKLRKRGVEPDESYYVQNEPRVRGKDDIDLAKDPPPDLVIEIDLTSDSVDKLGIYAALGVPEIWSHDGARIRTWRLEGTGTYIEAKESLAFPMLPVAELSRFLRLRTKLDETALVLKFQAWVRARFKRGR